MKPKITGLIGRDIRHSLSPCIHRAFFEATGLDGDYRLFDVKPAGLEKIIGQLVSGVIHGINVTMPYKTEIIKYCNDLSDTASRCHAVNTLYIDHGRVMGELTDLPGFVQAMEFHGIVGNSALVLGSGGAARAVVAGLWDTGFEQVSVVARNPVTRAQLSEIFPGVSLNMPVLPVDLIVNATPVQDMDILPKPMGDILDSAGVFFDLNYRGITGGMRIADAIGRRNLNGLAMLIFQAAHSWQTWFGQDPLMALDMSEIMRRCRYAEA